MENINKVAVFVTISTVSGQDEDHSNVERLMCLELPDNKLGHIFGAKLAAFLMNESQLYIDEFTRIDTDSCYANCDCEDYKEDDDTGEFNTPGNSSYSFITFDECIGKCDCDEDIDWDLIEAGNNEFTRWLCTNMKKK